MSSSGWAYGFRRPDGQWLSILGSAYRRPQLGATSDQAWGDPEPPYPAPGDEWVLARVRAEPHPGVTVTQTAYRILELAGTPQPQTGPATR